MTRTEFGRRFKQAREVRGFTQQTAADAIGVPQPRVAEYESGIHVPPVLRLVEIIEVLGLDPSVLFPEFFTRAAGSGRVRSGAAGRAGRSRA